MLASPSLKHRRPELSPAAVLRWNVALFLLTGSIVCLWFWRNSPWFDEFAALLTFGGALSWLAIAFKIVPEKKTALLQEAFFESVFANRGATRWHIVAFVIVLVATSCFATVQLSPLREPGDRPVVIVSAAEAVGGSLAPYWSVHRAADDFDVLPPAKDLRLVVPIFWSYRRDFVVKVGGYPDKLVSLHRWERRELIVPNSFRRPVVLLRPTKRLISGARGGPWKIRVRVGAMGVPVEQEFDGHAVWIGCDADVEVPRRLQELWAPLLNEPLFQSYWLLPVALALPERELVPGAEIHVELVYASGRTIKPFVTPPRVEKSANQVEFTPQVIDLDDVNPP